VLMNLKQIFTLLFFATLLHVQVAAV